VSGVRVAVVVTAGGIGARMGADGPKQFLTLAGRPVLARACSGALAWALREQDRVELAALVLSHPPGFAHQTRAVLEACLAEAGLSSAVGFVVEGGASRRESVRLALEVLPEDLEAVFVHDGARPLATSDLYQSLWEALCRAPGALGVVPLLPPADTLKQVATGSAGLMLAGTVDRESVRAVQTPQLFRWPRLRQLHRQADGLGLAATDDAALAEILAPGEAVLVVDGEPGNLKLTRGEDLAMAGQRLDAGGGPEVRVGQGFDVHAFVEGRPLVLGGVSIPHGQGLAGHSDADVLLHAISDAVLGAAGLDDIGAHFPDTDERWRGADSWELLRECVRRAAEAGWVPLNVDATLIGERPKIRPHVPAMRARIAAALGLGESAVNVKGTTTERLGFTGRGEGLAAQAVVLLRARN
jgi:2-C-methyl-D-erythritol 2,4-cyclodiphosphate synthase/2-C-methyl-D-erythritol 4-phosphate cytidylyltransferase